MVFVNRKNRLKLNLTYNIKISDGIIVLTLKGKIIHEDDYEAVQVELFKHINQNNTNIVLDLSGLTHTNSSGIAFFMRSLTKCRILGGEMVLAGITGNVKKVFEITKLNDVYTIFNSEKEALNYFIKVQ